jgi:hypothetical protein
MRLRTQCYLPETVHVAADPMLGLPDLRKGLNTILMAYLLVVGAIFAAVGIIFFLIIEVKNAGPTSKVVENASIVIFALILIVPLVVLFSLALIIRGKWLCLASAPEQHHAKWMMFLSILCIVAGPLLNTGGFFVGDDKPADPTSPPTKSMSVAHIENEIEKYKHGMPELGTRAYVKLAGEGIGMLSSVFFVLFLRAVAMAWGFPMLARFAELYLMFIAFLVFGSIVVILRPSIMLANPPILLALGAGWLLAGPCYFALILGTSIAVSYLLSRGTHERLEPAPAAPVVSPLASLPPIE